MKRVLHLISQLEEGGTQRQLSYVVSRAKQYEMEVASLIASPSDQLFPFFRNTTIPIHYLSHSSDFYAPEILPALRNLLADRSYEILHCWLYQSIVQGVMVSRLLGLPCIASPRSMRDRLLFLGANKKWEKWFVRKTLRKADLVLFPSHSSASDFVDAAWVDPQRVRVVQNGVDCEYFFPGEGGSALVAVGRLSKEKGYEELHEIVRQLRKEFPSMQSLIAGGGTDRQSGLSFIGSVDDIRTVLQQASVFIHTSRTEGMSNALLEAQAMGIPVVARNLGSNSEIVEDGVTGYLVETTEEFVCACRKLWNDPGLRAEMGRNARKRMVSDFSITQQVGRIEAIYSELL